MRLMIHVAMIVIVGVGGLKLIALIVTGDARIFPKD